MQAAGHPSSENKRVLALATLADTPEMRNQFRVVVFGVPPAEAGVRWRCWTGSSKEINLSTQVGCDSRPGKRNQAAALGSISVPLRDKGANLAF